MSDTAIIIQARTKSTRLPNKVLLPFFKNNGCLEILINRLKKNTDIPLFIATSINDSDDAIERLAYKLNIQYYRGDENNVLSRFIACAENFSIKNIIRVCSDNPFLDIQDLDELIKFNMQNNDYVSFK